MVNKLIDETSQRGICFLKAKLQGKTGWVVPSKRGDDGYWDLGQINPKQKNLSFTFVLKS